jgi:hypothetical protein
MAYADKEQLIADYIPDAKSQKETDAIGRILDAVSAFVDSYCKRTAGYFSASPIEPSMKRVRGEGNHFLRLPIHVFGTITQITTNFGSVVDSSAYYESDKNGWLYAEENSLYPETSFDYCSSNVWADGQIFKVTARWGYAETPKDLSEAVRLTVLRIWETQKGTLGQITPGGFVVERAMPPLAKEILDRYKRRQFEI